MPNVGRTVLFLAADPADAARLRLGEEVREIHERLQRAATRNLVLEPRLSVRATDLTQAIFDTRPSVVHFSGHGTQAGALCLEADDGRTHPVTAEALEQLFELYRDTVNCVVLNACSTEPQARAIATHIDYVIGMRRPIGDPAAIAFAVGFYKALAAGRSVEDCFKFGVVELRLLNIPEHDTPVLFDRPRARSLANEPAPSSIPATGTMSRGIGADEFAAERESLADAGSWISSQSSSPTVAAGRATARRGGSVTGDRSVRIGRDAVGNVITTGDDNAIEAHVTATTFETSLVDPATVDVAKELAVIRALLMSLDSEHATKIGRALQDAHEEASRGTKGSKDELGRALERALGYARSASAFATIAAELAAPLKNVAARLGGKWAALLTHLA